MNEEKTRVKSRGAARRVRRFLVSLLVVMGAVLFSLALWITNHFGTVTVDQVLVNIQGAGGEGSGGVGLVVSAIIWVLVVPILVSLLFLYILRKTNASNWKKSLPRLAQTGVSTAVVLLLAAIPVAGATSISSTLSLPQYVESLVSDQNIGDYYTAPTVISTPEGKPRNLVLIYMESAEQSLTDTSIFEKDMLAPIEEATQGWDSVILDQPAKEGWTLGGIVNTQCGFPLKMANTNLVGNAINMAGQDVASYLPGATCLGDVLEDQGYHSVYMGGANTDFAGKGTFLADHGYSDVLGRSYWIQQGETEMRSDWGLSDRRLMELAKEKVTELHDAGQPFNLTMLTLDTHPEDTVYPYCDVTTNQALTSIYDCSMQQVAGFVDYMKQQGYLDDTVVVLMGDHLRIMGSDNTFLDQLNNIPNRTIFNRIWSPDGVDLKVHEIDQFSMYPTILETLGYTVKDGRAGLGVSALETNPGSGTIRDLSPDLFHSLVQSRSQSFYDRMWGTDGGDTSTPQGTGTPHETGGATPSSTS